MRLWVLLCVVVLWDSASPQPTKSTDNADRECCPCPKDSAVASSNARESIDWDQSAASSVARADCPCMGMGRSADSDGAPSAFFPAAVRAIRPFVSLDDSKEEPKPLLHPEVDLASSVLDTLREATDEEYEEALARDAARAASDDGIAAESAPNLVTVIFNPNDSSHDDVIPEASTAHEARCINPLGRPNLSLRTSAHDPDILTDILGLPKRKPSALRAWNLFDMDSGVGASNVNEQVVKPNFKESQAETIKSPLIKFSNDKSKSPLTQNVPTLFKNTDNDLSSTILDKLRESKIAVPKIQIPDLSQIFSRKDASNAFRKVGDNELATNTIETDSRNLPSAFKLKIPHISTLIPNIDSTSRANDFVNENRNSVDTTKFDLPNIAKLIPKIDSSSLRTTNNDGLSNSGIQGSESTLKLQLPKLRASVGRNQKLSDDSFNSDSSNSASTIQERYSSFSKLNTDTRNTNEVNSVYTNYLKMPAVKQINLKQMENVDDEDNTPKKKTGFNLKLSDLNLASTNSRDAATDLLNNIIKGLQIPNLNNIIPSDMFKSQTNDLTSKSTVQKEVPVNLFETEILDTVPGASEKQTTQVNEIQKERDDDIRKIINEELKNEVEDLPMKTEILDSLPKSSEVSEIDDNKDPEANLIGCTTGDLINAASEPSPKSLSNDEETSELINEIESMNEDNIDDGISDGVMDRENVFEDAEDYVDEARGSLDELGNNDFASENKIDGLAINSDIQSLSEKSVPESGSRNSQDALKSIGARLRQRLDDLKLAPKKTIELPRLSGVKKSQMDQARSESQNKDVKMSRQDLDSEKSDENVDQVNIDDLQQMSDSLLNQENENVQKEAAVEQNDIPEIVNNESSEENNIQKTDNEVLEPNNINKVDSSCIVTPDKNSGLDMKFDSNNNEMTVGASERVANIVRPNLASPLGQSIIVQPTLFPSNLDLFNRPTLDLNNLINNPLPSFKIPNLLKASEDSKTKLFSPSDDSIEDILKPDSWPAPGTSSLRSSLPSLQPLEDLNLDILQLKPLSSDMPDLPGLNLNSFKTRLALPKSLDLKPVLLESSVGNKKGVIGATLTLGSGKDIDRSNLLQEASSSLKTPSILGQPLSTLPSFEDLHESFLEKTQNLLSTPLRTTGRNVVEDTFRSSQVLTDNLRVQAENTVKDIQENLQSALRVPGLPSPRLGSFRSSDDLLEEISRRHEDVNDKLKGISVDLSDRLESFRDNLLDQYRIPSLGSSLLGESRLSPLSLDFPKQSSTFRSKPSKTTLKFSNKGKFVTPASKSKSSSRTAANKNKLKAASSIVAPKAIEIPKLRTAPKETNLLKTLRKETTLKTPQFLSRDRPTLGLLQPEKNLIDFDRPLMKPRLGQSKVKISFSTTPLPPVLKNKPSFRANSKLKAKPSFKDSLPLSRSASKDKKVLGSKLSSLRDSGGFASENVPSRVKAPGSLRSAVESDAIPKSISTSTAKPVISLLLPKPKSLGKSSSDPELGSSALKSKSLVSDLAVPKTESILRSSDAPRLPALSWPKKLDDEFLSKVREALRARLADIGKKPVNIVDSKLTTEPPTDIDMARSASNNVEVTDLQTMKENTAYTCKMMCTKNT
ncbi:uncharacterized protein LOC114352128 [Ostrinia furnacalis]|uniref:uncharacterized protein LOC114352128 n=1 Tax=Ostrinia furnacalis TaxID=93504 RepID=UPI00103DD8DC|nr:uncharacterized protein LOC114352128 [Ostrinia furnacalis]